MTDFFLSALSISFVMALLSALLLVLTRLFSSRVSAKCRYLLWVLVVLRLCIPVGLFNFSPLLELELPSELTVSPVEEQPPAVITDAGLTAEPTPQIPDSAVVPVTPGVPEVPESSAIVISSPSPETPAVSPSSIPLTRLLTPIALLWLAVAVLILGCELLLYNFRMAALSRTLTLPDEESRRILEALSARLRLRRAPALFLSDAVESPMLCGYFRPRVLLPASLAASDARCELEGILYHELIHLRRGDLWAKLLCLIARSLHWFNPLVYLAAVRCNAEMELSCDERVLRGKDLEARRSYGNAMLEILRGYSSARTGLTTQFNPKRSLVRERFVGILDASKKSLGLWLLLPTLILCLCAGLFLGCTASVHNPPEKLPGQTGEVTVPDSQLAPGEPFAAVDYKDGQGEYTLLAQTDSTQLYVNNASVSGLAGGEFLIRCGVGDTPSDIKELRFSGSYTDISPASPAAPRLLVSSTADTRVIPVVFTTGYGTGVHTEVLRVFDFESGEELQVEQAPAYLRDQLTIASSPDAWTLTVSGESFTVGKSQLASYGNIYETPVFDASFRYLLGEDGGICCDVALLAAGDGTGFCNEYLRVPYVGSDPIRCGVPELRLRYGEDAEAYMAMLRNDCGAALLEDSWVDPDKLTAQEDIDAYIAQAYRAAYWIYSAFELDTTAMFCGEFDTAQTVMIDGVPYNNTHNPAFPSLDALKTAMRRVLSDELADALCSRGTFIDHEGGLWGVIASRGTDSELHSPVFAVTERSEARFVYTATLTRSVYDDQREAWVDVGTESYDFVMEKTADGWRFTQFELFW